MFKEEIELAESIKKWWDENKYNTFIEHDDEYNWFDEEPEFVTKAKKIIGNWEST